MAVREYIKPGLWKIASGYLVIQQRSHGTGSKPAQRYRETFKVSDYGSLREAKKAAEAALADYIKKYPPAKQLVPEGADKFLKTYLKARNLKSWDDLDKTAKSNFIRTVWPNFKKQQALIKGMIPESEMAERLGISKEKLANLRKAGVGKTEGTKLFHKKLVELVGKPVNLGSAAGGTLIDRGEYVYYNPIKTKDIPLMKTYVPKASGFIDTNVTNRVKTLADSTWFMNRLKDVKSVDDFNRLLPLETVKNKFPSLNLTDSKLSKGVVYLGQVLQGNVTYRGLENIGTDKVVGNRISRMIEDAPFGNFFKKEAYAIAMSNIDRQFGKEVGTFQSYKDKIKTEFRRLGFKDFKKFNLDEYVGSSIGGWKKSGQFSVFSRLLEKDINQKSGQSYLGRLSQATDKLEAAIAGNDWKEARRIVKVNEADALRTINKTKNTMPYLSLNPPGSKENFGIKRLNQLEAQGLGIKDFFKDRKYTYSGLGEAFTQKEILSSLKKGEKGVLKGMGTGFTTEKGLQALINAFNSQGTSVSQKNRVAVALGCIGKAEGGRIGYNLGSSTINCVNTKLTNDPVQSSLKLRATEGIGKVKNAATGFLSLLGKGGLKVAPYAALAAVGAAAEPLVKQFRNDDPSTYLSNPEQQKGMLLSTIEGETPKVDEEILKWQYPGLGAATVAGTVPGAKTLFQERRGVGPRGPLPEGVGKTRAALGIKGVLGKALGASFSPLAVAATLPIGITSQIKGGSDIEDIATDPFNWMGPAFASSGAELASKGIKNPLLLKALRLGMSPRTLMLGSRFLGLPGLALTAGLKGYDLWKNRE